MMMKNRFSIGTVALTLSLALTACPGETPEDSGPGPEGTPEDAGPGPEGTPEDAGPGPEEDAGPGPEDGGPGETIFDRLGGTGGIETAVGGFIGRVLADPAINSYFLNNDLNATRLTACLVHQVAVATGGPGAAYPSGLETLDVDDLNGGTVTCRSMETVHVGLGISAQDNADLTGHLVDELTDLGVAAGDIGTIGGVLGALTGIVENPNDNETLYHRLGRKPGITGVVSDFIGRVLADASINAYFKNGDLDAARLTTCLVRQVAQAGVSGGPAIYDGANDFETDLDRDGNGTIEAGEQCGDMLSVHTGMGISKAEHYTLVDLFIAAAVNQNTTDPNVNLGATDGADVTAVLDSLVGDVTEEAAACDETRAGPDTGCNVNTLYQRILGTVGLNIVVTDAFARILGDATTNGYFANANYDQAKVDRTAACLVRQFCGAAGGPCDYANANGFEAAVDTDGNGTVEAGEQCRDMLVTHAGLNIAGYEQEAFKGHVVDAVVAALPGIDSGDAAALVGVLDSTDADVIEADDLGVAGDAANLFHRIGGKPAIMATLDGAGLTDGLLTRVLGDNTINGFFAPADGGARLRTCLARQLCDATGGPCEYSNAGPLAALTTTDNGIVDTNATPADLTDDTLSNCLDMVTAHPTSMTSPPGGGGARIQVSDFNTLVGHAAATLSDLGVGAADIAIIGGVLNGTCGDMVEDTGNCP